jgi:D(-)-tartrate dehydratase
MSERAQTRRRHIDHERLHHWADLTQTEIARAYDPPLAAGEALFSIADARNLIRYGGLRGDRDMLRFDPVDCYGLPEYLGILQMVEAYGWSRTSFIRMAVICFRSMWPPGSVLMVPNPIRTVFSRSAVSQTELSSRMGVRPPDASGIGLETRSELRCILESPLAADMNSRRHPGRARGFV